MKRKVVNLPVLVREMKSAGLDAAVVASPENFFYLGGWKIQTQVLIRDRLALGIVTVDGDITLVVCKNEEAQTRRYASVEDVRTYAEFIDSPMKGVAAVLEEKNLARSRIGVERKYVTVDYHDDLRQRVPHASLTSCDRVFDRTRMVKTRPEIDALRLAAEGTDEAVQRALRGAKPGDPEHKLARGMADALFEIGHGEFRDITWGVSSGPNTITTHYWSGERELGHGEMLKIGVRSAIHGYYSHLYRLAAIGHASERHLTWYRKARDVQYRAIDRLRPGARACDLYEAARRDIESAGGSYRGSLFGHSTGIALHENPRIQPMDETVLEAGMVIASEPRVVDPDYCFYHLEDLVLVTEKDPIRLSDRTNLDELFVIR
ncbi:MAG: aminopeptidase P family protein [Burkholderiales bacterium]|nr:aminopeptidase P family protein [Burkholderiales bacterium]